MARQKGIVKIDGTIGDITFSKTKDGFIAKEKSEISKSRILRDPAFERTRENGKEFGTSAKLGKLFRRAIQPLLYKTADGRITARITKLMSDLRILDTMSTRGNRTAAIGILDPQATGKLMDVDFNLEAPLTTVVGVQINNDGTGLTDLGLITPKVNVSCPQGTTHLSFTSAWANVDLQEGRFDLKMSDTLNLPVESVNVPVQLNIAQAPQGLGLNLHFLKVEFYQMINGVQYHLNNGAHNALGIVKVA